MQVTLSQIERTSTLRLDIDIGEDNVDADNNTVIVQVIPAPVPDPRVGLMDAEDEVLNPYLASVPADAEAVQIDVPVTPGLKNIYVQVVAGGADTVLDNWVYEGWNVHAACWSCWETWFWVSVSVLLWILLVTFGILGAMRVKGTDGRPTVAWVAAILGIFPGVTWLELIPISMGYLCGS